MALAVAGSVLLGHALLLDQLTSPRRHGATLQRVQLRHIAALPAPPSPEVEAGTTAVEPTAPRPATDHRAAGLPSERGTAAPASMPARSLSDSPSPRVLQSQSPQPSSQLPPRPAMPPMPSQPPSPWMPSPLPLASPSPSPSPSPFPLPPQPPAGDATLPVYATRLAPAATLRYAIRREGARGGSVGGSASLQWAPEDGHYTLALQGQLAVELGWTSRGRIDAHGIAPDRYSESRRHRELRAANFERDVGRIRFSGPAVEHGLPPGAQDRLSWLLQLGAVLAANPALQAAGSEVRLFVAGSRGDAEVWIFAIHGLEPLALPGQPPQPALRVQRTATRAYDTTAEVWLDPSRHLLPLRAVLTVPGSGHVTELALQP